MGIRLLEKLMKKYVPDGYRPVERLEPSLVESSNDEN
jgi:hypothetical protein